MRQNTPISGWALLCPLCFAFTAPGVWQRNQKDETNCTEFQPRRLFPLGSIIAGNAPSHSPWDLCACGEHRTCYFPKWAGTTVRGPRWLRRRGQSNLVGTRVLFKTNAGSLLKYLLLLQNVLAQRSRAGRERGGEGRRGANQTSEPGPQRRSEVSNEKPRVREGGREGGRAGRQFGSVARKQSGSRPSGVFGSPLEGPFGRRAAEEARRERG